MECIINKRRLVVIISVLALFLPVLALTSGAAGYGEILQVDSFAVSGYSGYEADAFLPVQGEEHSYFPMDEGNVTLSGIPAELKTRTISGIESIWCVIDGSRAEPDGMNGLIISLDLRSRKIKLNDLSTLTFGMAVIGKAENCTGYLSTTCLVTSDGEYLTETVIEKPGTTKRFSVVKVDLTDVYGYAERLDIELRFDPEFPPMQVRVTKPFVTESRDAGFSYADSYAVAFLYYVTEGLTDPDPETGEQTALRVRKACDAGRISAAGRSDIVLSGRLVATSPPRDGSRLYLAVTVSDIRRAALYTGFTYMENSENGIHWEKPVTLNGSGTILIPVEITGTAMDLYLRFAGAEYERAFSVDSVTAMWIDTANPVYTDMGKIKSIVREGGTVKFSGSVTREAMKDLADGEVVFYRVNGTLHDQQSYTPVGRISLSTRFEFTYDTGEADDVLTKYACGIECGGVMYEICQPRYPDDDASSGTGGRIQAPTKTGLHGASGAGVFSTNVSHVMLDVCLDSLLSRTGADDVTVPMAYTVSAGGETVTRTAFLSRDILTRLDADFSFYKSADLKVYFRVMLTRAVVAFGTESPDGEPLIRIESPEEMALYAAVIGYLCQRYTGMEAIVLDSSVKAEHPDTGSMPEEMYCRAELARIAYNAACAANSAVKIAVDLGSDPRTAGVMFAEELSSIGEFPWYLMTEITDAAEHRGDIRDIEDNLTRLELYRPGHMCMYAPAEDGSIFEDYAVMLQELEEDDVIFLSVDGLDSVKGKEFYDRFRISSGLGAFISEHEAVLPDGNERKGELRLWDFSDKYHSLGWIAGGGTELLTTEYTALSDGRPGSDRVLKADIRTDDGNLSDGAGVIIRDFPVELDLSSVDGLEFEFALVPGEGSDTADTSVLFFMGSDDYRAEYTVREITAGERIRAYCDMREYGHLAQIGYVGALVYSGGDVSLELFSVTAYSGSLDSDGLSRLFSGLSEDSGADAGERDRIRIIIVLAAVAVTLLTVTLVVLALRHDREETEKTAKKPIRKGV